MAAGTSGWCRILILLVAFLALSVCGEFETVELRIGHSLCIVAVAAFLNFHSPNIRRLYVLTSLGMMAFFTPECFLVFLVGESRGFCAGSSF
jgi:hypothetical protein